MRVAKEEFFLLCSLAVA